MGAGGAAILSFVLTSSGKAAAALPSVSAFRNPGCECCEQWAQRMKQAGFAVTLTDDPELDRRRAGLGVPASIAGCHLATAGGYLLEGHVPPEDVLRLLREKPEARGLAVPGMPVGSPGMEGGGKGEPFDVLLFAADGTWKVFASH